MAIGDVNGDSYPDVLVAAELGHLIYLQNPGSARAGNHGRAGFAHDPRTGSYLRVFFADFKNDGQLEATTANKGAQRPCKQRITHARTPVSLLAGNGDPLATDGWAQSLLGHYSIPQNAEPVTDQDG